MKISDCCGVGPFNDQGLCPRCREHCTFIEDEDDVPFNQLTPAQAERLALLAEECGEVIQAVGKILRHGYESRHPDGGPTNRQTLEIELGHVDTAISALDRSRDISYAAVVDAAIEKKVKVMQYLHHQRGDLFGGHQ